MFNEHFSGYFLKHWAGKYIINVVGASPNYFLGSFHFLLKLLILFQVSGEVQQVQDDDDSCDSDADDDDDESDVGDEETNKENDNVTQTVTSSLLSSPSIRANTLNLDITAMIAYVSALTNGFCKVAFKEPILSQQAEWERLRPVKVFLDKVFQVIQREDPWLGPM